MILVCISLEALMNPSKKTLISLLIVISMLLSGCTADSQVEENNDDINDNIPLQDCELDNSCFEPEVIYGCIDKNANNFDSSATDDDESCTYDVAWQSEYGATWEQHEGGEECECSDGSNFSFWSRNADPTKVVLYFQGGGACWDSYSCQTEGGTYKTNTGEWDNPTSLSTNLSDTGGIFNFYNQDNPLADWSFVFVPYCTGDLHLGDMLGEYSDNDLNHSGHTNAQTAYSHVLENFPNTDRMLVTGSSAGSIPTSFYAALVSEDYPDAEVSAFIDASGGLLSNETYDFYDIWGLNDTLPDFPIQPLDFNNMTSATLVINAWMNHNNITFARFDNAYDNTMRYFNALLDNDPLMDYHQQILYSESLIDDANIPISTYLAPGDGHTILGGGAFYTENVEDVAFVDWFTAFINGDNPDDVHCTNCN
jgi:hypothetical protein